MLTLSRPCLLHAVPFCDCFVAFERQQGVIQLERSQNPKLDFLESKWLQDLPL